MIEVKLANYEVQMAGAVGYRRQLNATMKSSEPRWPEEHDGQLHRNHMRGAMAELAVAKYLNVYWGGHFGVYTSMPDVDRYEVRYLGKPHQGLKIKEDDTGIVIGVTGQPPNLKIVGWIVSEDGMREEWSKDFGKKAPPAFFVPLNELRSVEELKNGQA